MKWNRVLSWASVLLCMNTLSFGQKIELDLNRISLPSLSWSLNINLDGYDLEKNEFAPNFGARNLLLTNKENGMTVSIFMDKARKDGDAEECREYYWSKALESPLEKQNIKTYEKDNIAFAEHNTKTFQGVQIDYHSVNAYLSTDGYWIDVHMSKPAYTKKDKGAFADLIASIEIENPKKANPSESFLIGSRAYYFFKHKIAIICFEDFLEAASTEDLEESLHKVVIDNLGMSYGMTGDLANSKRVYQEGIKVYPDYPMFYYNLACTYAEMKDIESAVTNLKLAWERKDNMLDGEPMPNPQTDESFKDLMENDAFIKFLESTKL